MSVISRHKTLILCSNNVWRSKVVESLPKDVFHCFAHKDATQLPSLHQSLPPIEYIFWVVEDIISDYVSYLDQLFNHWPNAEHTIVMCKLHSEALQVNCKRTLMAKVAHCYLPTVSDINNAFSQVLRTFFPTIVSDPTPTISSNVPTFTPSFKKQSSPSTLSQRVKHNLQRDKLIVVASSTGGIQALSDLLSAWPLDLNYPTIIAHHLPARFQDSLQEILQRVSHRAVQFVTEPIELTNAVYVSPFDYHVRVYRKDGKLWAEPHQGPKEHFLRPAADPLFRSAGDLDHTGVVAVVLTGMGKDGMDGSKHIHANGGRVLCQDESSSVVWGMPKHVFDLGITEGAYHPSHIGQKVLALYNGM